MAKTDFKSADEYIATHPERVQTILQRVRTVRQGARSAAGGGGAGAARVPQMWDRVARLCKGRMSDLPRELLGPVFLPGAKLLPVV